VLLVFLRRTPEKNSKQRVGDVRDVRLALEGAFEPAALPALAPTSWPRGTRVAWLIAAAAVLGKAALARPALRNLDEAPPPEARVDLITPATSDPVSFALSPDGRQIVFVASADGSPRLWLRSLSSTTAQPLAGTDGAAYPFWAPDSRSLGFFADGQLKRLDLAGGAPRTLGAAGARNAEGVILFAPTFPSPLFRISAAGGDAAPLTHLERQVSHRFPVFLPDGRHFVFYASGEADASGIYLGALDERATTRLTAADTAEVYLPSEWLLWVREGTIVAQPLDLERQVLTGDPVTLADAVAVNGSYFGGVSVSASGLVAYRTHGAGERRQLTWFERTGKVLDTLGASESTITAPRVSSDGRRVAVLRSVQDNEDLWLLDSARMTRLTYDPGRDDSPVWSPDGRRKVFASIRMGPYQVYLTDTSGAGEEKPLAESGLNMVATDGSPDGRFLLYTVRDPQTDTDFWVRPMQGDPTPWTFLKRRSARSRAGSRRMVVGWLTCQTRPGGWRSMSGHLLPAVSGSASTSAAGRQQVSIAGGIHPSWRADGQELYYIAPDGVMMAAPVTTRGSALEPGTPIPLFQTRLPNDSWRAQYDVTRDGRFLVNTVLDNAATAPITLIQNWRPEVKP
jgi:Tol biopolymer transport system component